MGIFVSARVAIAASGLSPANNIVAVPDPSLSKSRRVISISDSFKITGAWGFDIVARNLKYTRAASSCGGGRPRLPES